MAAWKQRKRMPELGSFPFSFLLYQGLKLKMALPTFKVDLPTLVNPFWKHPQDTFKVYFGYLHASQPNQADSQD
jgi:hypothetical protein